MKNAIAAVTDQEL